MRVPSAPRLACTRWVAPMPTRHTARRMHIRPQVLALPALELKNSEGKGLGLFAKETIPAYSRLLSDQPLISLRQGEDLLEAYDQFLHLPEQRRLDFFTYHSVPNPGRDATLAEKLASRNIPPKEASEMVRVSSVFTANAFKIEAESSVAQPNPVRHAMFPLVCRLNHSCLPNAHANFNQTSGAMNVHSLYAIEQGSEIQISYFNLLLPVRQRQAVAAGWGFECSCPACTASASGESNIEEECRTSIREAADDLQAILAIPDSPKEMRSFAVHQAQSMIALIEKNPFSTPQLPIAYDYLARAQMLLYELAPDPGLSQMIRNNLNKSVDSEKCITGVDSHSTWRRLQSLDNFDKATVQS